jgi:hypothetical protein
MMYNFVFKIYKMYCKINKMGVRLMVILIQEYIINIFHNYVTNV